jgi:predicted NBD/HSP70 family sugar kinase
MALFTADVSSIREHNLSLVLNLIRQAGSISRADIVRTTRLSATTVSALANVVLDSGFVHESGAGESSGGRPPILLQFDYAFRHVLGIDMGATHLTAVVMDLQGCVVARRFCKFDVLHDANGATAAMRELAAEVMAVAGLDAGRVLGLGIAAPAPLEGDALNRLSGVIAPEWAGRDLVAEMAQALDVPIYLDNDANAGAIAEKWWGEGRDYANLAYIKLGTGVGSGLIMKDEIYRGDGGTAGEIGHTTIDSSGPLCRCGNRGCLESFVGVPALIAEVRRLRGLGPAADVTVEEITTSALDGDPVSRQVVVDAGNHLGIAIANLLNLFNPGLIVLGGELAAAGELLLQAVHDSVAGRAMPKAAREARITISRLGEDAVAMGAATLAMQNAFQPSNLPRTLKVRVIP